MSTTKAQPSRLLNFDAILRITAKYGYVTPDMRSAKLTVESVSKPLDVKKGANRDEAVLEYGTTDTLLRKRIVTFSSISQWGHEYHQDKVAKAKALEATDPQAAHELYQAYLDGARISGELLSSNAKTFNMDLQKYDECVCQIVAITTENGKLLRVDGNTIRVKEVAAPAKFVGFGAAPMVDTTGAAEAEEVEEDEFTNMDRTALRKYITKNAVAFVVKTSMTDDDIRAGIRAAAIEAEA